MTGAPAKSPLPIRPTLAAAGVGLLFTCSCLEGVPSAPSSASRAPIADLRGVSDEVPAIRQLEVHRDGEAIRFSVGLVAGPGTSILPLDPGCRGSAAWTFQLGLDLEPEKAAWGFDGADIILLPKSPTEITVLAPEAGRWREVATAGMIVTPSQARFNLPASVLLNDDGRVGYELDVFKVTRYGDDLYYSRVARHTGNNAHVPSELTPVPVITRITTDVRGDSLFVRGQFTPRETWVRPFYSPTEAGGWQLQLFLNTDRSDTGYWLGFDYVVRGSEWQDDLLVIRQTMGDCGCPGGWGPEAGRAMFHAHERSFVIAIPLSMVGDTDGLVDYALESYVTVPCAECPQGISAIYADDYFGSTSGTHHRALLATGPLLIADDPPGGNFSARR